MSNTTRRVGVVLFQLGGPDSLEAIEPFLFNLFSDPEIIDFPFARIGRRPLAKLISTVRAKRVEHHYKVIGGASPIARFTARQAQALQTALLDGGIDAYCCVAMRYWHPYTSEAIDEIRAARCDEIVLLPLYPQYSATTTGSSLKEWRRSFHADVPEHCVHQFYRHDLYLEAMVEKIDEALGRFAQPHHPELVFSAHSVPVSVIEKGDPYQQQIEETMALIMARGRWANHFRLCYQSKVGASKWLQPSLHRTLRDLATEGKDQVCIVPLSFVSDHVETLGEIDHEARAEARTLGIRQFEMMAGLNDSPKFIAALADLVMKAIGANVQREQTEQLVVAQ
ncbi:MAG: ferrochelatase [Acidobacteriales bacterium]|nr:ferrochelatase [Terriglobales bacterium]